MFPSGLCYASVGWGKKEIPGVHLVGWGVVGALDHMDEGGEEEIPT